MSAEPHKGITVESDVDYHVYPNATAFAVATNGQVSLWAEDKALAVYAPGMWRAAWFTSELEASD